MNTESQLINAVTSNHNFAIQVNQLASHQRLSRPDAKALLLTRVWHRLPSQRDEPDLMHKLQNKHYSWLVTYARMDVEQKLNREKQFTRAHQANGDVEDLELYGELPMAVTKPTQHKSLSYSEINEIFRTRVSREFVTYLISYGELETRAHFNLTKPKFRHKIMNLLKFIDSHKTRIDNIVYTERTKERLDKLAKLQAFIRLVEDNKSDQVPALLHSSDFYTDLIDKATEDYKLHYQARVYNHFGSPCCLHDSYKLVNEAYKQLAKVVQEANGDEISSLSTVQVQRANPIKPTLVPNS